MTPKRTKKDDCKAPGPPGILTIIYNGEIIYAKKAPIGMCIIDEKDKVSTRALDTAIYKCPLISKVQYTQPALEI